MIDPDISSITLELEIMALFDAIPDGCKTQRFWDQFKRLCPDALLKRLLHTQEPVKPIQDERQTARCATAQGR